MEKLERERLENLFNEIENLILENFPNSNERKMALNDLDKVFNWVEVMIIES